MADWLQTLSPRDRELASVLAVGEPPSVAARKFRVTRGRVSQLRRELYESWLRFTGEVAAA
jgi:predicted transcriptional regulator